MLVTSPSAPLSNFASLTEIEQGYRLWQRWTRARITLELQAQAIVRSVQETTLDEAKAIFRRVRKTRSSGDPELDLALFPYLDAIARFEPGLVRIGKILEKDAKSLPVWPWVRTVRGFGAGNLAKIVGEAGDVSSYKSVAAVWKRFGLAVLNGERQRLVAGEDHGYSPRRRAVCYVLGECLIKKKSPRYYELYLARKAYELAREDEGKPVSLKHAHNRAARVMVKRVLQDLYLAWRRA